MIDLKEKRVLVIAPHPDDETLGCGGTIRKIKAMGGSVHVIALAVGNIAQIGGMSETKTRVKEFERAMELLGVDSHQLVFQDDNKHLLLDALPQKTLIDIMEKDSTCSMMKIKPHIVLIPAWGSANQDHKAVHAAAMAALRPRLGGIGAPSVLAYEQTDILWGSEVFVPSVLIDISEFLPDKLNALKAYASQMRAEPELRSIENVERLARLRGSMIGVKAAEAFTCIRMTDG